MSCYLFKLFRQNFQYFILEIVRNTTKNYSTSFSQRCNFQFTITQTQMCVKIIERHDFFINAHFCFTII